MLKLHFHQHITNLFLDIKSNIVNMLSDKYIYTKNRTMYKSFIDEIIHILNETLSNIEKVYYKYFLYPKIQDLYNTQNNVLSQ